MPASIGVNLRVTGHCSQGGRKYMEDLFSVAYQQTEDERDLEYAFFGIYDGHGGSEAAAFAKEHLMDSIVKQRQFWSDNDEDVLKAIRNGYMLTHLNMWKELEKWPKTVTGLPSTAGTTASVAFIRKGKIYIGHVGDSAIVLGYQKDGSEEWAAKPLTCDHKPESTAEIERIQRCGGKVISKAGVPRVVWNRPRLGHKGPIKKNTPMDEIPFLAVARSLGDLWSYNPNNDEFIVSPDPDVGVLTIDPSKFRCLIFGTDGLWNMMSPEGAVSLVQATEKHNEAALVSGTGNQPRDWLNPSKSLVDHALERWSNTRMRADNTSVVTLMLDPPGPPRATVLRSRSAPRTAAPTPHTQPAADTAAAQPAADRAEPAPAPSTEPRALPQNGLTIMTRYSDVDKPAAPPESEPTPLPPCGTLNSRFSIEPQDETPREDDGEDADAITNYGNPAESYFMARLLNRTRVVNTLSEVFNEIVNGKPADVSGERRETSPATDVTEVGVCADPLSPAGNSKASEPSPPPAPTEPSEGDVSIQINEVSSSSPTEVPPRTRGRRQKTEARRDAPAVTNDRVLRSHHETEAASRPHTRQSATRPPASAPDRVVILSRRAAPPAPAPIEQTPARAPRPPRRQPPAPPQPAAPPEERGRATRAHPSPAAAPAHAPAPATVAVPLAQKITRGIGTVARELRAASGVRAGNCLRAPGPARRAPAARREPSLGSKENLCAARRRGRGRAAAEARVPPAPAARARRALSPEPEVHSTTGALLPPCAQPATTAIVRPRALRSRNEAESPAGKRARCESPPGGASAKPAPRALAKRAAGPWAPALALRNRLRRRLGK